MELSSVTAFVAANVFILVPTLIVLGLMIFAFVLYKRNNTVKPEQDVSCEGGDNESTLKQSIQDLWLFLKSSVSPHVQSECTRLTTLVSDANQVDATPECIANASCEMLALGMHVQLEAKSDRGVQEVKNRTGLIATCFTTFRESLEAGVVDQINRFVKGWKLIGQSELADLKESLKDWRREYELGHHDPQDPIWCGRDYTTGKSGLRLVVEQLHNPLKVSDLLKVLEMTGTEKFASRKHSASRSCAVDSVAMTGAFNDENKFPATNYVNVRIG